MVILHVIIAHLLGDFVFQPNKLIEEKYHSWLGLSLHTLIVGIFFAFVLFPYWQHSFTWIATAILMASHFIQDSFKVYINKNFNKKRSLTPFLLDQFLHLLVIILLGRGLMDLTFAPMPQWVISLYFYLPLTLFVLGLLIATFVFDICEYESQQRTHKNLVHKRDYLRIFSRAIIFSFVFLFVLMHLI